MTSLPPAPSTSAVPLGAKRMTRAVLAGKPRGPDRKPAQPPALFRKLGLVSRLKHKRLGVTRAVLR